MAKNILGYYSEDEWKDSIDRARLFAARRGIENPIVFVHDAIYKLVQGERTWSPDYPLANQLIHIVRSDSSHAKEKSEKHLSAEDDLVFLPEQLVNNNTPDRVYLDKQLLEQAVGKINESGDEISKNVIKAILKNGFASHENAAIATFLGLKTKEVENAKKRIARMISGIKGEIII